MSWKSGSIIRNKQSGKPLKVLHAYKGATVVVDLEDGSNPTPTLVLLERDYNNWIDERKLECKSKYGSPKLIWSLAIL